MSRNIEYGVPRLVGPSCCSLARGSRFFQVCCSAAVVLPRPSPRNKEPDLKSRVLREFAHPQTKRIRGSAKAMLAIPERTIQSFAQSIGLAHGCFSEVKFTRMQFGGRLGPSVHNQA